MSNHPARQPGPPAERDDWPAMLALSATPSSWAAAAIETALDVEPSPARRGDGVAAFRAVMV